MSPQGKTDTQLDPIAQDERAFYDSFPQKDGIKRLPETDVHISDAALKDLRHDTSLGFYQIKKSDLEPGAAANPVFAQKDAAGKDIPIYVTHNVGGATGTPAEARLMHTKEGNPFILVNEAAFKWTKKYVTATKLLNEQDFKDAIGDKDLLTPDNFIKDLHKKMGDTPEYEEMKRRYDTLQASVAQEMDSLKVKKTQMVIDNTPGQTYATTDSPAAAHLSLQKTGYVVLNKAALLEALASDEKTQEFKGVIGHELDHIKHKDETAAGIMRDRTAAASQETELLRSLEGSGPLGSRNPEKLANYFDGDLRDAYAKTHPDSTIPRENLTDKELKPLSDQSAKVDLEHPSSLIVIEALRKEALLMKEYKMKFEAKHHHAVTSPKERAEESKQVISQVMHDMKDKIKMDSHESVTAPQTPALKTPFGARGPNI